MEDRSVIKQTYCGELVHQLIVRSNAVELVKSNYTVDGVQVVIRDKFDKQEYIMILKPKGN